MAEQSDRHGGSGAGDAPGRRRGSWAVIEGLGVVVGLLCGGMAFGTARIAKNGSDEVGVDLQEAVRVIEAQREQLDRQQQILDRLERLLLDRSSDADIAEKAFEGYPLIEREHTQTVAGVTIQVVEATIDGAGTARLVFEARTDAARDTRVMFSGSHNSSKTRVYANDHQVYHGGIQVDQTNSIQPDLVPGLPFRFVMTIRGLGSGVTRLDVLDLGVEVAGERLVARFTGIDLPG